jgi:acyl dehydratase
MPLDYDRIRNWRFPPSEQRYTARDTILYGLGIGLGDDPLDRRQLRFVYEDGLAAFPTMATVLGAPGFWMRDPATGLDWRRTVHAEQALTLHAPLPPAASVVGTTRVIGVIDKGDKGALILTERSLRDAEHGTLLATVVHTSFGRGDGGFGDRGDQAPPPHVVPVRAPDASCTIATAPAAALIYRLSGDDNPLHADPDAAARVGFARPILHGLASFGIAARAVLATYSDYDSTSLRALQLRCAGIVYPGESLRFALWRDGSVVSFTAHVVERAAPALTHGRAELA